MNERHEAGHLREAGTFDAGHLEALLESAQLLHGSLDLDELLRHLLRATMGRLLVRRGLLALDDGTNTMRVALSRGVASLSAGALFDPARAIEAGLEVVLPIGDPAHPAGLLAIGASATGDIGEADRDFLSALLGIASSGIANARAHAEARRLNLNLERRVQDLRTVLDLTRGLTSAIEIDDVARHLGLTLAGQWAVRKWAVLAWKEGQPTVIRQKGMAELAGAGRLREELAAIVEPSPVESLSDRSFAEELTRLEAKLVLPLRAGTGAGSNDSEGAEACPTDVSIGAVLLGAPPGGRAFTADEVELASALAAQAVVAFENAWHFADTLERRKLEKELALAASIQDRLFPSALPSLPGWDLAARNRPARQVGGDYYDAIPVGGVAASGGPHLFCVADVSGKGIAASLLMSNIQATLRALLEPDRPLADLVARTNDLVYATTAANKFVTAILLLLDPSTGEGRFVNAGHNDGIVVREDGSVERLRAGGLSIGLMPTRPYKEGEVHLAPGDLVALYSDGVTEANDPNENEFETERLIEVLRGANSEGRSAAATVALVFDEVDRFAATAPQYDDITLMVIRRER